MTTTRKISLLFISIIFLECTAQKQSTNYTCIKLSIESENQYHGENQLISNNLYDFNLKSNKSLDIIRISSKSGYEHEESFKRIFIEDNKVFITDENKTKVELFVNKEQLQDVFMKCNGIKSLINCRNKSSQNYLYRFFVKKGNEIVMTFTVNELIKNIESDLIKEELVYINFFEQLK